MISLMLAAALFAAAEPAAAPAQPAKAEKADKDKVVCRSEAAVGSRLKTRTCLTQADWDARGAEARSTLEQTQRNRPLQGN